MPPIRSKIDDLVNVANRAEKALKTISRSSTNATKLSTGAIYGCLGFLIGSGTTFVGLAVVSSLIYAPFLVPVVGICGLLVGVLAGRDSIDRANERAADLVDQVWTLRDWEVDGLARQIKDARRTNSPRLSLLEQKRTFLELAPPERLMDYYGLIDRKLAAKERDHPLLGPGETEIRLAWDPASRQVESRRQIDVEDGAGSS
ncbi:hypothetical protein [Telmatospirillum siberiense]|uniref:Uncharacterized protein n=1 Tax=Telmatospirillum siberiense TaxID=382514 RepID=A0A2N3PRC9_9PROT|nr:hypothetical protein [Telmatospirillum siberiense]PKU22944.1 hypothetical protein CWS72_19005 [Telmatospirillum siberiense]